MACDEMTLTSGSRLNPSHSSRMLALISFRVSPVLRVVLDSGETAVRAGGSNERQARGRHCDLRRA